MKLCVISRLFIADPPKRSLTSCRSIKFIQIKFIQCHLLLSLSLYHRKWNIYMAFIFVGPLHLMYIYSAYESSGIFSYLLYAFARFRPWHIIQYAINLSCLTCSLTRAFSKTFKIINVFYSSIFIIHFIHIVILTIIINFKEKEK